MNSFLKSFSNNLQDFTTSNDFEVVNKEYELKRNEVIKTQIMAYFKPRTSNNGDTYYEKLALSNSFLMHVLKVVAGIKEWGGAKNTFSIGKSFEDLLMNTFRRERYPTLSQNEVENVMLMVESFKASFGHRLKEKICEDKTHFFEYKGLKFKGKTDFETLETVFDIKTTNKTDIKGCQASVYTYNYHTQGYLYEIATNKPFILLFQSKNYPFDNFRIELTDKMRDKAKLKIDKAIKELERLELTKHFLI